VDLVEGRLDAAALGRLKEHVAGCRVCAGAAGGSAIRCLRGMCAEGGATSTAAPSFVSRQQRNPTWKTEEKCDSSVAARVSILNVGDNPDRGTTTPP
jgi:hypothetical protein